MPAASLWLLRTLCRKVLSWAPAAYSKPPPRVSFCFFFVCFKLPTTASQAQTERRTRLPLASPGASAFSLPMPPAPPKARGHSEGSHPRLRSNTQRVSNSLPPEHHMVIIVWATQWSDAFAQLQLRTKITQSGFLWTHKYWLKYAEIFNVILK